MRYYKNFKGLQAIIKSYYPTYSGKMLERYFRQKLAESLQFREIGSLWEPNNEQHETSMAKFCHKQESL